MWNCFTKPFSKSFVESIHHGEREEARLPSPHPRNAGFFPGKRPTVQLLTYQGDLGPPGIELCTPLVRQEEAA